MTGVPTALIRPSRTTVSRRLRRGGVLLLAAALTVPSALGVVALPGTENTARAATAVRAAAHDGYGRMVFDWDQPVRYDVEIAAGNLIVSFDRPVEAATGRIPEALADYVAGVRVSPDGRTVTMPLKDGFTSRSFTIGTSVVVDLLGGPARAAGSSASAGGNGPAPTPSAPRLPVRTGEHPGFFRVVFDWNRPVDYKVLSNGDDAVVTFDAAAQIDLDAFRAAMPQELRNVGVARENGQTLVTVPLPADGRVRHFTSGTKVVLDLLPPAGRQPPRRTPEEREAVPDDAVAAAPTPAALPAPKPAGETAGEDAPAPVQPPQALSGARPQAGEEGDRGTEATPATALVNALREARGEKAAADERRRQMAQAAEELEAAANTGEAVDAGEDEQAAPDVRARVASLSFSWNEPDRCRRVPTWWLPVGGLRSLSGG